MKKVFRFQDGREVSMNDPKGVLEFPWGVYLLVPIAVESIFLLVAGILFFSGAVADDEVWLLVAIVAFASLICGIIVVTGLWGMSKRRRIREQMQQGMPIEMIQF